MTAKIYHIDLYGTRDSKYKSLSEKSFFNREWSELKPSNPFYLFVPQNKDLEGEYNEFAKIMEAMPHSAVGIATSRDELTIQYSKDEVYNIAKDFSSLSVEKARLKYNLGRDTEDWNIKSAQNDLQKAKLSKEYIIQILYRPFDFRATFYTGVTKGFISRPRYDLIRHLLKDNLAFYIGRQGDAVGGDEWNILFCGSLIEDYNLFRRGNNACFPLYLYPTEDNLFSSGDNKPKPNFTKEFLEKFKSLSSFSVSSSPSLSAVSSKSASPSLGRLIKRPNEGDDLYGGIELLLFRYIYAVFHSPTYRERYAEFLKIDFPRVPIPKTKELFQELSEIGNDLIALHLLQEEDSELVTVSSLKKNRGISISSPKEYKFKSKKPPLGSLTKHPNGVYVEKGFPKYENGNVYVNDSDYFESVPEEVWNFHIGGYQVLHKWLKDRRERALSDDDILHYRKVVVSLSATITIMREVDDVIMKHGGFPDAFGGGV